MDFFNNISSLLHRPSFAEKNQVSDSSGSSTRSESESPVGSASSSLASSLSSQTDLPKAVRFSDEGPQVKTFEKSSPMIKGLLWYGKGHSHMMQLDSALENMLETVKAIESHYSPTTSWAVRMRVSSLRSQIIDARRNIERAADRPTSDRMIGQMHQNVLSISHQLQSTLNWLGVDLRAA